MFSLIYAWINDWVNNHEAGDLRRQHGHYDVIVMRKLKELQIDHSPVSYHDMLGPLSLTLFNIDLDKDK